MLNEIMVPMGHGILALGWYTIFMIVTLPLLGIAWGVYIWWDRKMEAQEEETRKKGSQHLRKSRNEVSDWAQQMAKMETPKRRPPAPKPPGGQ